MATLTPADREELESATSIGWVRILAVQNLHRALAKELGRTIEDVHEECVTNGTARAFQTVWKVLLRFASPQWIIQRAPSLYAKGYDTGRLEAVAAGEHSAVLALREWPGVPDLVVRGLRIGVLNALTNTGREGLSATYERTHDGARITVRWTK